MEKEGGGTYRRGARSATKQEAAAELGLEDPTDVSQVAGKILTEGWTLPK